MDILERLRRIKKGLWIAVGVAFGVLFALVVVVVLAVLVLHSWDTRNLQKTVKTQIGMELISVPPGTFQMGSADARNQDESPAHQVTISKGFLIGKYEVTAGEWKTVMGKEPPGLTADYLPAQFITWNDVQEFIRRLNQKNDGYIYRLPTEAEWEYACRGGAKTEDPSDIELLAWYDGNSKDRVHPVGMKHANDWGFYDMRGNVSEWVQDWYDKNYYAQSAGADPQGPSNGKERVKRGGSRYDDSSKARCSSREEAAPTEILDTDGFRIAAVAGAQ